MEGAAYGIAASVVDLGVELLEVLVSLEDEVGSRGEAVVAVVLVKTVALEVSCSVICDLSVAVASVVVRKTSVTNTRLSV